MQGESKNGAVIAKRYRRGGGGRGRRRSLPSTAREATAGRRAKLPVGRQKASVVSSRTARRGAGEPGNRSVHATERWRSQHCGSKRGYGHCCRRGCGGGLRRKSCREHDALYSRFPSDGDRESLQVLRATADGSYSDLRSCPDDLSLFSSSWSAHWLQNPEVSTASISDDSPPS